MKLFTKKYYYLLDFQENCKHKIPRRQSLSCRKRRDGTMIGSIYCNFCEHFVNRGGKNDKVWIKCAKINEARGIN